MKFETKLKFKITFRNIIETEIIHFKNSSNKIYSKDFFKDQRKVSETMKKKSSRTNFAANEREKDDF